MFIFGKTNIDVKVFFPSMPVINKQKFKTKCDLN